MLRSLLLVLLLANLAFFVWSQGGVGSSGAAAGGEHEPERLARQVRPEAVQLLTPPVAASAAAPPASVASAVANPASAAEAASAPEAPASAAASSPVPAEASMSAAGMASAASATSTAPAAAAATALPTVVASASAAPVAAPALLPPAAPPGTRCMEAAPFSGTELATVETALAANAKTNRIARRWLPIAPDAASAVATPQHRLRIDATPGEVAVLESLPASVVGRSFTPCTAR